MAKRRRRRRRKVRRWDYGGRGNLFSRVARAIHDDPTFRDEPLAVRYLWLYLQTTRRRPRTIEGLLTLTMDELAEDVGLGSFDELQAALDRLEALGWAVTDWEAGLVLLPPVVRERPPANPNGVRAWRDQLRDLPASPLVRAWLGIVHDMVTDLGGERLEAFEETLVPPATGSGGGAIEQKKDLDTGRGMR